ncbi:Sec-independent protein translocase protein TatB [Oceanicaulis sp.]|jgi:sec-independent protein translocase protein TatB|uniref:Sec-independent protein translocase protein TatB n=1 Tax=Oceanicaulis sp. TaxID=1924941 RepID=UPI003F6F8621
MNPAFGFQELIVIVILALVVVGPKDLPLMVRRVGKMIGQIRATAREFQRSFDELGREAELAELRKEISSLKSNNPIKDIEREFLETDMEMMRDMEDRPHPRTARPMADPKPLPGEALTPDPEAPDASDTPEPSDAPSTKTGEG